MTRSLAIALALVCLSSQSVGANPITHLFKSGWHAVVGHGGRTAAKEGVKHATKQFTSQVTRHSANSVVGPRTALALRHFGDDAVRVGGKLVGKPLSYADDLTKVSAKLSAQSHRRLMMLAPELKKSGQAGSVITQLAKSSNADKAVAFLWRHKGKLATATAVGAAAWHADAIAEAGGKYVLKPAIEGMAEHVARPIVSRMAPLFAFLGLGTLVCFLLWLRGVLRIPYRLLQSVAGSASTPLYLLRQVKSLVRFAYPKQGR